MRTFILATALLAAPLLAQDAPAPDYARAESWLCRPGSNAACDVDLGVTDLRTRSVSRPVAATAPAVDCFYVYPTVSEEPGLNAGGQASEAERYAVAQQFARFGTVCRLFAPLYRQVTLRGLVAAGGDRALALGDVKAAWTRYLQADNDGRGVILIGHSQGARMLKALLAEAIVGTPAEKRIIAAYLIGNNLLVPAGKVSGGELGAFPLCERGDQTGCAVSYVSFRSSAPPPANARFGRSEAAGMEVACVSPAMLSGDKGELRPVLPVRGRQIGGRVNPVPPFLTAVKTPSYTMTGAFSGVCMRSADGAHYLSVAPRASVYDDFLARAERPDGGWGLHVADVSLAMGNLVTLAAMQRDAWLKSRR